MAAHFYMLRLESGRLYPGATTDLEERLKEHRAGRASRTTARDPLVDLAYTEEFESFAEARRREAQIKHWSAKKKEALVTGDLGSLRDLAKSRDA